MTKVNEYWYSVVKQYFNRTTAYIISKKGAQKIIDYTNNKITITNDCSEIEKNCRRETYNLLNDTKIISNLIIEYNISCVSCD